MNIEMIYLIKIEEPEENSLRLTFSIAKTNNVPETFKIGGVVHENTYLIISDPTVPFIQINFETYIGYSILNECFISADEYEEFEGKVFRIYSKSRYLDFIRVGTFASEDYPGPFKHYEMACLNHIVDVVSVSEPDIKKVK